jgi:hypothetical protein
MKTKITKQTKQTKPFPKLMIDEDGDVFFMVLERKDKVSGEQLGQGVLIHSVSRETRVGAYSESWCLSLVKDFDGTVELSN